ncbi:MULTISPECIES: sugar transferase [unclassified Mesorhizobium]|uniref:sugar transferase n=1 Tax=unclassified Mesorhizobium TaxID=325217 RepID=UPI00112CAD23|nr:sugar transferase [Mesorhizobium sp. B2-6-4]TPM91693.1 sugar transferase [Mesorhizobium sp. B2-1-5]
MKRTFDLLGAACLLLLMSPFIAVLSIAVALLLGRPVFFRQERPGLHGKPFKIIKLRTMTDRRDRHGRLLPDADRLTGFGSFLRASSLDELPELINVLRGEMSLVGPRPLLMEYLPRYSPEQARRHQVIPGITGLAQVNGRNALDWENRFVLDVWYVDHRTFVLDLKILCLTFYKIFTREGISAAGHATMPEFMGSQVLQSGGPLRTSGSRLPRLAARVAAIGILLELGTAAFVFVVDPYGINHHLEIPDFNAEKTHRLSIGTTAERSLRLWLTDYDTLILGGSRARVGLDPAGPSLARLKAYNAAVPHASMVELYDIGMFALAHGAPRRMIVNLDFSMFEADRTETQDFPESGFAGVPMPIVYARSLFSPESFIDALRTVHANSIGFRETDKEDGFHQIMLAHNYSYRQVSDQRLNRLMAEFSSPGSFDYDITRIGLLHDLLDRLTAAGVDVTLFISPIHARQMEALRAMGLLPVYDRWRVDLTYTVSQVNASKTATSEVKLWDFSGYNSVTMEDIPDPGDRHQTMRWYWSSARYTPALGELMLDRMLGQAYSGPSDFGISLTGSNLRSILDQQRKRRTIYVVLHPEEINRIWNRLLLFKFTKPNI